MFGRALRLLLAACVAGALASPGPARADRDRQHEEARRAVERGEALPLPEILARVGGEIGGEVVGLKFRRAEGRWIYEFRVIGTGGKLSEVSVDAASAGIIRREGH